MPDPSNPIPGAPSTVVVPHIDYRETPNSALVDAGAPHATRDDPNAGGVAMPPQFDDSFMSYDTPGDALGKWNEMIHDKALQVTRDG